MLKNVISRVNEKAHRNLKALAVDRGISLGRLTTKILEWAAGDQDVSALIGYGVDLPMLPSELEEGKFTSITCSNSKVGSGSPQEYDTPL